MRRLVSKESDEEGKREGAMYALRGERIMAMVMVPPEVMNMCWYFLMGPGVMGSMSGSPTSSMGPGVMGSMSGSPTSSGSPAPMSSGPTLIPFIP
eukprot:3351807-Rhodomonas_salina.1